MWNTDDLVSGWIYGKPFPPGRKAEVVDLVPTVMGGWIFNRKKLYKWLAIAMEVIGNQNKPEENVGKSRPLCALRSQVSI